MSIKIFAMTHMPFTPPGDPMYVPMQVGCANAAMDLGFLRDDTGENISAQNAFFCELTGMYWIWKNFDAADFIGICHYRRYLINEREMLFSKPELFDLLSEYDMVTSKLLTLPFPYKEGFCQNHHAKDLAAVRDVIQKHFPGYILDFDWLAGGPHTYFGNIFVTSRKIYHRYCKWLFTILFEVQKHTDFTGYNRYQKRLFGFLSEFLQTVWIQHNHMRVYECKVGMTGEKYETKQLREEMAQHFRQREYEKAKECFLRCYEKRPDVLMEASDVTGELRLCMQIISTCSFEDASYGRCILDDMRNYSRLIRHFHRLNEAVMRFSSDMPTENDLLFFKQTSCITPVSIEIAVKLFCKDILMQSRLAEKICACLIS